MSLCSYFKNQSRGVFVPSTADSGSKLSAVDVASCIYSQVESTEKKKKPRSFTISTRPLSVLIKGSTQLITVLLQPASTYSYNFFH